MAALSPPLPASGDAGDAASVGPDSMRHGNTSVRLMDGCDIR